MRYRTYEISGRVAYAKGYKMNYPKSSTINKLKSIGVNMIIWCNGDFLSI